MAKKKTMDGNEAAAYASYAFTEIAAIYPITPSSPMADHVDTWAASGMKNIFGQSVKLVEMQSEAGAVSAMHGALDSGSLGTSYTASQGMMLMIPTMYRIAGELKPAVIHAASRNVATNNISIFAEHSDVMACRQTGFALLASSNVQECMDIGAVAHLSAIKQKICQVGAGLLGLDERAVVFAGDAVTSEDGTQRATLAQIAAASQCGSNTALEAVVTHSSEISPPPFMVGAAEVEVDLETGEAQVIRYEAAVDCGTPVNPNLARVQAEGGILQGIGMALTENVTYDDRGMPQENSLMQYKIPARNDIGHIHVVFENSYEGTGPFGAKSIGEVVINTPLPAVADAIYHATHKRFYELPITREQIALAGQ